MNYLAIAQMAGILVASSCLMLIFGYPIKQLLRVNTPTLVVGFFGFWGLVPFLLYAFGRYSFGVIALLLLLFSFGSCVLLIKNRAQTFHIIRSISISPLLLAGSIAFAASMTLQKFPVPPGIDSAVHAGLIADMMHINSLKIGYPLGMHFFVEFLHDITNIPLETVFHGFHVFLYFALTLVVYAAIKSLTKRRHIAFIGTFSVILSASFYNNLLNGSTSHLFAVVLLVASLAFFVDAIELARPVASKSFFLLGLLFGLAFQYSYTFGFALVICLLVTYFAVMLIYEERHVYIKEYIIGTIASLFLSYAVHQQLWGLPGYRQQISALLVISCVAFLCIWLLILIKRGKGSKIFGRALSIVNKILFPVFVYLLIVAQHSYQDLFVWYGLVGPVLATIAAGIILFSKKYKRFLPVVYFTIILLCLYDGLYNIRQLEGGKFAVIGELLYYYGFDLSFLLLGAFTIVYIYQKISFSGRWLPTFLYSSVIATLCFSILSARVTDTAVMPLLKLDPRILSLANRSDAFGLFFTADDIAVIRWADAHVGKNEQILNLGGLYGVWANLANSNAVMRRTGIAYESPLVMKSVARIEDGDFDAFDDLLDHGIRYVFVPEKYSVLIENDRLSLLDRSGGAAMYEIHRADRPRRKLLYLDPNSIDQIVKRSPGFFSKKDASAHFPYSHAFYVYNNEHKQGEGSWLVPPSGSLTFNLSTELGASQRQDMDSIEVLGGGGTLRIDVKTGEDTDSREMNLSAGASELYEKKLGKTPDTITITNTGTATMSVFGVGFYASF